MLVSHSFIYANPIYRHPECHWHQSTVLGMVYKTGDGKPPPYSDLMQRKRMTNMEKGSGPPEVG